MKKLIYGGLFLAVVGIGIVGCKKEEVLKKNNSIHSSNTYIAPIEKSFTNPFDEVGKKMHSLLTYIDDYSNEISNSNVYCPIEYVKNGKKDYSTKTKMLNRIKQFAINNEYSIVSDDDLSRIYDQSSSTDYFIKLDDFVNNKIVSQNFKDILINYNSLLRNATTNEEIIEISQNTELSVSRLNIKDSELELLYSIISGIKYTSQYLLDNGNSILPVNAVIEGMPCGVAVVGYQAGFIGLCMATGPVGWVVGGVGFACGLWGVIDSCNP